MKILVDVSFYFQHIKVHWSHLEETLEEILSQTAKFRNIYLKKILNAPSIEVKYVLWTLQILLDSFLYQNPVEIV